MTSNEDSSLCARCGGQCCLTRPGIDAPEGFLANGDLTACLAARLDSGQWVLEEHIGIPYPAGSRSPDPDRIIRYPRPATRSEQAHRSLFAQPETGPCCFLGDTGCLLAFPERPKLCRELQPDVCFECESPWGRRDAALAWLPHQEAVSEALSRITPNGGRQP